MRSFLKRQKIPLQASRFQVILPSRAQLQSSQRIKKRKETVILPAKDRMQTVLLLRELAVMQEHQTEALPAQQIPAVLQTRSSVIQARQEPFTAIPTDSRLLFSRMLTETGWTKTETATVLQMTRTYTTRTMQIIIITEKQQTYIICLYSKCRRGCFAARILHKEHAGVPDSESSAFVELSLQFLRTCGMMVGGGMKNGSIWRICQSLRYFYG